MKALEYAEFSEIKGTSVESIPMSDLSDGFFFPVLSIRENRSAWGNPFYYQGTWTRIDQLLESLEKRYRRGSSFSIVLGFGLALDVSHQGGPARCVRLETDLSREVRSDTELSQRPFFEAVVPLLSQRTPVSTAVQAYARAVKHAFFRIVGDVVHLSETRQRIFTYRKRPFPEMTARFLEQKLRDHLRFTLLTKGNSEEELSELGLWPSGILLSTPIRPRETISVDADLYSL